MGQRSTAAQVLAAAVVTASLALGVASCSSGTTEPTAPGTSAVLGGSGSSASSTTSPSNSEEGTSGNPGSVSEQRPPMGEG